MHSLFPQETVLGDALAVVSIHFLRRLLVLMLQVFKKHAKSYI